MEKNESIILGGGCFWCLETIYKQVRGVISVVPGYAGGHTPNPTYERVSTGTTGHAEVVKIIFDNTQINLDDILAVFFSIHDPTTPDRQGHDIGPQYRSAVYFTNQNQEKNIQNFIRSLKNDSVYKDPIITEIKPLDTFYEAEDYHHDYFAKNPTQTYCQIIINPKLQKFKEKWQKLLK